MKLALLLLCVLLCGCSVSPDDPQVKATVDVATAIATMPSGDKAAPKTIFEDTHAEALGTPDVVASTPPVQQAAPVQVREQYLCPQCKQMSSIFVDDGEDVPAHGVCPACQAVTTHVPK